MLIELKDVTKSYGEPESEAFLEVLKGISLTVAAGESVAIVGPSGSGKSTVLNIMGGLAAQSNGTVRLDGRELASLSDAELANVRSRDIGFVFQLHHLLPHCTVMENVLVPTLPVADKDNAQVIERARELLDRVGLIDRAGHRPAQLSGGEMQRVAVVRALINQPRLLLADEPTGSLDSAAADELGKLLVELNEEKGLALVVVTHSQALAGRMSRQLSLQDGLVSAMG